MGHRSQYDCRGWRPRQPGSILASYIATMGEYAQKRRVFAHAHSESDFSARAVRGAAPTALPASRLFVISLPFSLFTLHFSLFPSHKKRLWKQCLHSLFRWVFQCLWPLSVPLSPTPKCSSFIPSTSSQISFSAHTEQSVGRPSRIWVRVLVASLDFLARSFMAL